MMAQRYHPLRKDSEKICNHTVYMDFRLYRLLRPLLYFECCALLFFTPAHLEKVVITYRRLDVNGLQAAEKVMRNTFSRQNKALIKR